MINRVDFFSFFGVNVNEQEMTAFLIERYCHFNLRNKVRTQIR